MDLYQLAEPTLSLVTIYENSLPSFSTWLETLTTKTTNIMKTDNSHHEGLYRSDNEVTKGKIILLASQLKELHGKYFTVSFLSAINIEVVVPKCCINQPITLMAISRKDFSKDRPIKVRFTSHCLAKQISNASPLFWEWIKRSSPERPKEFVLRSLNSPKRTSQSILKKRARLICNVIEEKKW